MGVSVLAHLVLLVVFLPPQWAPWHPRPKKKHKFEVTTTVEEVPKPAPQKKAKANPDKIVEAQPKKPIEPDKAKKPKEKKKPKDLKIKINRKVVQQETNHKHAKDAKYLSQHANKVKKETRARKTTTKNVLPGKTVPKKVEELTGGRKKMHKAKELASRAEPTKKPKRHLPSRHKPSTPTPQQEAAPSKKKEAQAEEGMTQARKQSVRSPVIRKRRGKVSPQQLFQPSAQDYNKVFGENDKKLAGQIDHHKPGRRLLAGWKKREKAVKASLQNNIVEVRPGNHTGVNADPATYANYIARIHRKIHAHWGASYLPMLDSRYGPSSPLSDPSLVCKLEFVIDAKSGHVDEVNIVKSSGQLMYDAEAVNIAYMVGPHPNPPGEIVSPDGKVYIHWTFWRDQRQCGPFGASVYIVNNMKDRGGRSARVKVQGGSGRSDGGGQPSQAGAASGE